MKVKYLLASALCLIPGIAAAAIPYRAQQNRMPAPTAPNATERTTSFEAVAGIRIYDTFRVEANYVRTRAKWNGFSLDGNAGFINAIIDARIDNLYRLFYHQRLVPYVGAGAGLSWNKANEAHIDNKITPAVAAMAGLGVEMGDIFTVDLGYRYMYMFTPKFDNISDLAPSAHQFRIGARVNFC